MNHQPHRANQEKRQTILLFLREFRQEGKRFGFGDRLDRAAHLAMQQQTLKVVSQLAGIDLIIVSHGRVPDCPGALRLSERGATFNDRFRNALDDCFARLANSLGRR